MTEAAIVLDGQVIGRGLAYVKRRPWVQGAHVGRRNLRPVLDPTFRGVQHAEGVLRNLVAARL